MAPNPWNGSHPPQPNNKRIACVKWKHCSLYFLLGSSAVRKDADISTHSFFFFNFRRSHKRITVPTLSNVALSSNIIPRRYIQLSPAVISTQVNVPDAGVSSGKQAVLLHICWCWLHLKIPVCTVVQSLLHQASSNQKRAHCLTYCGFKTRLNLLDVMTPPCFVFSGITEGKSGEPEACMHVKETTLTPCCTRWEHSAEWLRRWHRIPLANAVIKSRALCGIWACSRSEAWGGSEGNQNPSVVVAGMSNVY